MAPAAKARKCALSAGAASAAASPMIAPAGSAIAEANAAPRPIGAVIAEVFAEHRPSAYGDRLELMDLLAVEECTDAGFLPPRYRQMPIDRVQARIAELRARLRG